MSLDAVRGVRTEGVCGDTGDTGAPASLDLPCAGALRAGRGAFAVGRDMGGVRCVRQVEVSQAQRVVRAEPSSMGVTPSRPTLSLACASRSPMGLSLLAEMDATCVISRELAQGLSIPCNSPATAATPCHMHRLSSIACIPPERNRRTSRIKGWASTKTVLYLRTAEMGLQDDGVPE